MWKKRPLYFKLYIYKVKIITLVLYKIIIVIGVINDYNEIYKNNII